MSVAEKVARGILVALETPGHWRDYSAKYAAVTAKYQPHQGRRECARRLQRMQSKELTQ